MGRAGGKPGGLVDVLVRHLGERREEIALAIHARLHEAVPHPVNSADATYQSGVLAAIVAVLDYALQGIPQGPNWRGPPPQEALAQARRAARAGINVGVVLRRYVAGRGVLGEFVMEAAEACGLSADERRELRKTQETLLERLTEAIEAEYMSERERLTRSPELRCAEIVRRLLTGEALEPSEMAELNYKIHGSWHLGLMFAGGGADDFLHTLTVRYGRALLVAAFDGYTSAWVGGTMRPNPDDLARLWTNGKTDISLGLGEPGKSLEGWRLTHDQARDAMRIAQRSEKRLATYGDDRLLAATLLNETLVRSLNQTYLRPLAGQRDGGMTLRRTLRIYIDSECNATCAAHALEVGRRAVKSRVQTAEELIGSPLRSCLAELDVALRLAELERGVGQAR